LIISNITSKIKKFNSNQRQIKNLDINNNNLYLCLFLFILSFGLTIYANSDWLVITSDTLLLVSTLESLEKFSSIFEIANSNPLQGLFDIFPSGLRLGLIPSIISSNLFNQEINIIFIYIFMGVFLAYSIVFFAITAGFSRLVSLLSGIIGPFLLFPIFGMFPLTEHIYILWPTLYYNAAFALIISALFILINSKSYFKFFIYTILICCISMHLALVNILFLSLIAPGLIFMGFLALALSPDFKSIIFKILSVFTAIFILWLSGMIEYAFALGQYNAHTIFFQELISFMQFGKPNYSVLIDDLGQVFKNPFKYRYPGGNSIEGLLSPLALAGSIYIFIFGQNRSIRMFSAIVFLMATSIAFVIAIIHYFYYYTQVIYLGPDPRHFVRILWPFYFICISYLFIDLLSRIYNYIKLKSNINFRYISILPSIFICCLLVAPILFVLKNLSNNIEATNTIQPGVLLEQYKKSQIFPTYLPPYKPQKDQFVEFLSNNIGLQINKNFNGSVTTFPTEFDANEKSYAHWKRDTTFTYTRAYVGNDFGAFTLRHFNIPTFDQFSHTISPQFYLITRELLSRPYIDKFDRHYAMATVINEKILKLLGLRYFVTDYETTIGKKVYTHNLPEDAKNLLETQKFMKSPLFIYELQNPNIGNYSPTKYTHSKNASDTIKIMSNADFDGQKFVVINDEIVIIDKLSPAIDSEMSIIRGGINVKSNTTGHSILVLPVQYSHCWKANKNNPNIQFFRANLMQLGIYFSENISIDIKQVFGPFGNSQCKLADSTDIKNLDFLNALDSGNYQKTTLGSNIFSNKTSTFFMNGVSLEKNHNTEGKDTLNITATGKSSEHYLSIKIPSTTKGEYEMSAEVKSINSSWFILQFNDGINGVLTKFNTDRSLMFRSPLGNSHFSSSSLSDIGGGWYKVSIKGSIDNEDGYAIFQTLNSRGSTVFKPDNESLEIRNINIKRVIH
jgi:hypothetical protein